MRVLCVEDDVRIGAFVVKGLREAGHTVDLRGDGVLGLQQAALIDYDAYIVDVMLPSLDGLSLIAALRQRGDHTPVLALSARSSVDDRVKGLEAGADDYLTKPFSFVELLARLRALHRRSSRPTEDPAQLQYAGLVIDLRRRQVSRDGAMLDLQPKEFQLLEYLMRNPESVASRTMLLEHIWDYSFDPQTNVVDVLVSRLRKKVDRDYADKLIHTLRGVGYVLRAAE